MEFAFRGSIVVIWINRDYLEYPDYGIDEQGENWGYLTLWLKGLR